MTWRLSLFLLAAIVLIVFGIIASAGTSLTLFGVQWYVWFMASFLAYLVDLATSSWAPWVARPVAQQPPA